jgi:retron-type reverse transcriptase
LTSSSLKQVYRLRNLEAAWKAIHENGRSSKSESVRNEIALFEEESSSKIRSLAVRLVKGRFKFPPARGIAIRKENKKDTRPIVLASVEARIVQRAILQVLQQIDNLQPYFRNPYSFGGIKRDNNDALAAVPAAINGVLHAIQTGACFVACSDISSFFTCISKSAVSNIIASAVSDVDFMALFQQAIRVELSNLVELREMAQRFPTEDVGVTQGNSLSPLLGNIILHEFDKIMNEGDCRCIRYIDDFIILAPTKKATMARLRKAKEILGKIGMSLAEHKTSTAAISVKEKFEFLGIEFHNGLIRPAPKARAKFLDSVKEACDESQKALRAYRSGEPIQKSSTLLGTFKRVDGMIQGWGKHYFFCRDEQFFSNLDNAISEIVKGYLGFYREERAKVEIGKQRAMFGLESLSQLPRSPFDWIWPNQRDNKQDPTVATLVGDTAGLPWD